MGEKKGCGCITIIGAIAVLALIGSIINFFEKPSEKAQSFSTAQKAQSFPESSPPQKIYTSSPQPEKTPAENLAAAKKFLADKSKTTPYGNIFEASQCLEKIKAGEKEYAEAQKLLKHIAECYKKLDQPIAKDKYKKQSGDVLAGISSAEEAGLRLFALQSKGYIRLHTGEPSTFIEVEPIAWKSMMHQDKEKMCRLAQAFITGLNQQQGKKIQFIFFKDMTSRETLAEVSLRDSNILIKK